MRQFKPGQLQTGSLYNISASFALTASALSGAVPSSSYAATASFALSAATASYYAETDPIFTAISGTLATTGSNTFTGNQTINGNITVNGTASVALLYTTYQTSSIIYTSGSTKFGDTADDTHQFTGSLFVDDGTPGNPLPVLDTNLKQLSVGGMFSIDWAANYLYRSDNFTYSNVVSLDWMNGKTFDGSSIESIDWTQRTLSSFYGTSVDWGGGILRTPDGAVASSLNWSTRQLISSDGTSIAADWNTKELLSTGNRTSIDWENRELVGSDGLTHILNWTNTASAWFSGSVHGTASWARNALTASYVNPLQQDVQLTGSLYLSTPGVASIYFTGSGIPGKLTWNDTDGTLELGLKGGVVKTEVGQGLVTRVVNKTSPDIDLSGSNYQVVVVSGAQGQRLAVKLAQADNDANSAGTLGIVAEDIAKNQEGFIITVGLLKNRNTTGALQGETWSDGDILYLSPTIAGAITNIKPQAPQHTVIIGYVEYAHAVNGKIYVKIDNGYEIDELHNVRITTASLAPGQLLVRSGSNNSGVWINTNQLTGSYGITGSLTATSFTGSLLGTASYATTALTASYVAGASSFPYTGSAQITGSLGVTGSTSVLGSIWSYGPGNINTNTAFGQNVFESITSGYLNTTFGKYSLQSVTSGYENNAFGYMALNSLTSGYNNTAIGYQAGRFVTTGTFNTAVGAFALQLNTSAFGYNTAIGHGALQDSTGEYNTSLGYWSGKGVTTGQYNTFVGYGNTGITTGNNNTIIGYQVLSLPSSTSNSVIITDGAGNIALRKDSSNYIGIGYNATASLGAKLDVKAQGALSSDLIFRVRNSADTDNIISVKGNRNIYLLGETENGRIELSANGGNASMVHRATAILPSQFIIGSFGDGGSVGQIVFAPLDGTNNYPAFTMQRLISGLSDLAGSSLYTGFGTNAATFVMKNASGYAGIGTNPTGTATDHFAMYSDDIAPGTASAHFRNEAGHVVKLYTQAPVTSSQGIADVLTNLGFLTGSSVIASTNPFPYTGSAQITGSVVINNYLNTAVQVTANSGATTIYTLPTASYDGAWFEYSARSGSNARAGQITAIWSGSAVNFTETTTTDFGSTADLSLGVFIIGANMALTSSASTSGWSIKTIIRSI